MKKPKPSPKSRDTTTIVFATNRPRLSDAFAQDADILPGAAQPLWLGTAEVGLVGDPLQSEALRQLVRAPDISGDDDFADPVGGACARVLDGWLADATARGAVPVLFIHGFSTGFADALQRAAQIEEFYAGEKLILAPLVFSWPSDGLVVDPRLFGADAGLRTQYLDDQRDAGASAPALARLLREIWRARVRATVDGKAPRLVLLAHSMGNHALAAGLSALNNGLLTREMAGLFAQALLVSSDVPSGILDPGQPMRLLPQIAEQVAVCISYDSTLHIASEIANGNRRLGHWGAERLDLLPETVQVVDFFFGLDAATRDRVLKAGGSDYDVVQHQWYRNDTKARAGLAALLSGGKLPFRKLTPAEQSAAGRYRHAVLD